MFSWGQSAGWFGVLSGMLAVSLAAGVQAAEPASQTKPAKVEAKKNADPLFPFTISKETTRITEPLKPDGTVDYAAALNARNSQGVTPGNNAGVPLMQAFGAEVVPEENRETFFKALGIPVPDEKGPLKDFGQFVEQHLKKGGQGDIEKQRQTYLDQQYQAMSQPWSRKVFPFVADWLEANAEAMKLAIQASRKPRLFFPLVVEDDEPLLLNSSREVVMDMRPVGRLLSTRAMLAVEEGRIEDAQNDLLACHRLAFLLGQQLTMIEALVSYAMNAIACEGDRALAQSEKATQQQLASYRQKLAELPALPKMSEKVDWGERFLSLDAISNLAMQRLADGELAIPDTKIWKRTLALSVDWDLLMRRINEKYDQMVAALRPPSHAAREAEISKIEGELDKLRKKPGARRLGQRLFVGPDLPRAVVYPQLGDVLLSWLIPEVRIASQAETRAQTRRDLTILALALGEYQREHGEYPQKLNDLSPNFLKTIPQDRFTDKPLKYQREDGGYRLYSVGPNGKDDQGQARTAQGEADDLAIRVPSQPEL